MKYTSPQGLLSDDFVLALEMRCLDFDHATTPPDRAAAFGRWQKTVHAIADALGQFVPKEFPPKASIGVVG